MSLKSNCYMANMWLQRLPVDCRFAPERLSNFEQERNLLWNSLPTAKIGIVGSIAKNVFGQNSSTLKELPRRLEMFGFQFPRKSEWGAYQRVRPPWWWNGCNRVPTKRIQIKLMGILAWNVETLAKKPAFCIKILSIFPNDFHNGLVICSWNNWYNLEDTPSHLCILFT